MPEPTRDISAPTADPVAPGATPSTSDRTAEPGGVGSAAVTAGGLEGYELLSMVGQGGMGVVYRARDLSLNRDVAVKMLHAKFAPGSLAAHRFREEARITGQLQHPGIPPIHQVGTLPDGRPFLAMKLIRGQTLADLLASRPSQRAGFGPHLPVDPGGSPHLVAVFEQVCQAVAYAHNHGVVHRDLKPHNVMVGQFGEVQVMDWGLAKFCNQARTEAANGGTVSTFHDTREDGGEYQHTRAGSILGTPAYMPPEQAIGAIDQIDERSDVFGLGGILCAILTGRPPYVGDTAESTRQLAAQGKLGETFAQLDCCAAEPELVVLCKRCLSVDKAARPRNAGEVAAAVSGFRAQAEDRARQAEVERARAEVAATEQRKRRRVHLALAAAVLVLVAGGGAFAWWQERQVTAREADARDRLARTTQSVNDELHQAAALREQARALPGAARGRWAEALAAARRAHGLATAGDASPELVARVSALVAELEQEGKDRTMTEELDEIPLRKAEVAAGQFNVARIDADYEQAFRAYGIDLDQLPFEEAVARVSGSAIRLRLAVALTDWIDFNVKRAARLRFVEIAAAADPDPWRQQLRDALIRKDGVAALELARTADLGQPRQLVALLGQSLARSEGEYAAVGFDLLRRVQQRYPNDFWVNHNLAWMLRERGSPADLDEAIRYYSAAVALRPESPGVRVNFGLALSDRKRYEEAMASYREAIRLKPDYAEAYTNLGLALEDVGEPDRALEAYRTALAYKPELVQAHNNLGRLLARRGHPDEGITSLREAIRLNPEYPQAHFNLGRVLSDKGLMEDATDAYREAARLRPASPTYHISLGSVLFRRGLFDEAAVHFRRGHELGAKRPDWKHPSATWVRESEQFRDADRKLPAILRGELAPADTEERLVLANLCRVYRNRYAAAVRFYSEAFTADPKLAADLTAAHRYYAACAAARAAGGHGLDAPADPAARADLRANTLAWLRADLDVRRKQAASLITPERKEAAEKLAIWLRDPDLAGVRPGLARIVLTSTERAEWAAFWVEVRTTLAQASAAPVVAPPPWEVKRP